MQHLNKPWLLIAGGVCPACYLTHNVFNTETIKSPLERSVASLTAHSRAARRLAFASQQPAVPSCVLTAVPCRWILESHFPWRCSLDVVGHTCVPTEPDVAAWDADSLFWRLPLVFLASPVLQFRITCPIPGFFLHFRGHPGPGAGCWCPGAVAAGLGPVSSTIFGMFIKS